MAHPRVRFGEDGDLEAMQAQFMRDKEKPAAQVVRVQRSGEKAGSQPTGVVPREVERDVVDLSAPPNIGGTPTPKKVSRFAKERQEAKASRESELDDDPMARLDRADHGVPSVLARVMVDVQERPVDKVDFLAPAPRKGGFPRAGHRSEPSSFKSSGKNYLRKKQAEQAAALEEPTTSEHAAIHKDNLKRLEGMSPADIVAAQEEIRSLLSPETIARMQQSKMKKDAERKKEATATKNKEGASGKKVTFEEQADDTRGGLKDHALTSKLPEEAKKILRNSDTSLTLTPLEVQKMAWMSQPESEGNKKRHSFARSLRFDFSGKILGKRDIDIPTHAGLHHHGEDPDLPGYTLQELFHLGRSKAASQRTIALHTLIAIIASAKKGGYGETGDSILSALIYMDIAILARMTIDETSKVVCTAGVQLLHALVVSASDESATARMDLMHRGHETVPLRTFMAEEVEHEDGEVAQTDAELAREDVIDGLLRTRLLERIRYLLEVAQYPGGPLLEVLLRVARHSVSAANGVLRCPRLVDVLRAEFIECSGGNADRAVPDCRAIRILRVVCQAGREMAKVLVRNGAVMSVARFLLVNSGSTKAQAQLVLESLLLLRVCMGYELMTGMTDVLFPFLSNIIAAASRSLRPENFVAKTNVRAPPAAGGERCWCNVGPCVSTPCSGARSVDCYGDCRWCFDGHTGGRQASSNGRTAVSNDLDEGTWQLRHVRVVYELLSQGARVVQSPREDKQVELWARLTAMLDPAMRFLNKLCASFELWRDSSLEWEALGAVAAVVHFTASFFATMSSQVKTTGDPLSLLKDVERFMSANMRPLLEDPVCAFALERVAALEDTAPVWMCSTPPLLHFPAARSMDGNTAVDCALAIVRLVTAVVSIHKGIPKMLGSVGLPAKLENLLSSLLRNMMVQHSPMGTYLRRHVPLLLFRAIDVLCVLTKTPSAKMRALCHDAALCSIGALVAGDEADAMELLCNVAFDPSYIKGAMEAGGQSGDEQQIVGDLLGLHTRIICGSLRTSGEASEQPHMDTCFLPTARSALPLSSEWLLAAVPLAFARAQKTGELRVQNDQDRALLRQAEATLQLLCVTQSNNYHYARRLPASIKVFASMQTLLLTSEAFSRPSIRQSLKSVLCAVGDGGEFLDFEGNPSIQKAGGFYAFFSEFLRCFSSSSFGDEVFAQFVMLLLDMRYTARYRKLIWGEHQELLPLLVLSTEGKRALPHKHLLYPVEADVDVLSMQKAALSRKIITKTKNPLLYWTAVHHQSMALFSSRTQRKLSASARKRDLQDLADTLPEATLVHVLCYEPETSFPPSLSPGALSQDRAQHVRSLGVSAAVINRLLV